MADVPLQKFPVPPGDVDATGTPDSTTFLRGDGAWVSPASIPINSQASDYTLALSDAGGFVRVTAAATITVPPEGTVDWSTVGDGHPIVNVRSATTGTVVLAAGSGVTINTPETLTLDGQWAEVSLHYVGSDEWDLVGAVEASP